MLTRPHPVTRRCFLKAAGHATAVIGASQVLSSAASAGFAAEAPLPPVAVFGKVFQQLKLDFRQSAEVTAEAGLDGVDCAVRPVAKYLPGGPPSRCRAMRKPWPNKSSAYCCWPRAFRASTRPMPARSWSRAKSSASAIIGWVSGCTSPESPRESSSGKFVARLKELAAMNRDLGMCGIFQNHSPWNNNGKGPVGGDLNELYGVIKDFDPREIAVAFDLGHAIIVHKDQWRVQYERLAPHIRVVYVKDVQRPSRFLPFGQGEFGRSGFFPLLAKTNYRAPLSMHMEYEWAPKGQKTREGLVAVLKENRHVLGQWWKGV